MDPGHPEKQSKGLGVAILVRNESRLGKICDLNRENINSNDPFYLKSHSVFYCLISRIDNTLI
jgi:hypothetical protein